MSIGIRPPPPPPTVRFLFIPEIGSIKEHRFTISAATVVPLAKIRAATKEMFDEDIERVNVLYLGEYRDMFIGATSSINGRHIRNIRATEIYRNNMIVNVPGTDPDSLPALSGPAVLFPDYQVWK
ncbi:hypothetical protein ABE527_02430 [Brucella sp. TWI432]